MFKQRFAVRGWRWAIVLLLVVGLAPGYAMAAPSQQASGGAIQILGPVYGTLDSVNSSVSYDFEMKADLVFSLWAWNQSGDVIKGMTLTDAAGQTFAEGTIYGADQSWTAAEALIVDQDGTYTVTLTHVGGNSGEYGLVLMPGYSTVDVYDLFDGSGDSLSLTWETFDTGNVAGSIVGEQLQLTVSVENMLGYMLPEETLTYGDLYVESDIQILGNPSYYEYGLLLRVDTSGDSETFYSLSFSSDSDYSLYYYNGEWNAIQEWTVSSVIDGADRNPRIGVLAQGNTFRIYFNDRLVDIVTDADNFASEGQIAVTAGTLAGQNEILQLTHDNLVVTVPDSELAAAQGTPGGQPGLGDLLGNTTATPAGGMPFDMGSSEKTPTAEPQSNGLTNWNTTDPAVIVNELVQKGIVPAGGSIALTIPNSFGDTSSAGYNYYPLGRGRNFRNFVAGFDAHLDATGAGSGCGMHFRAAGATYSLALVFEEGAALLAQFSGTNMDPASVYEVSPAIIPGQGAVNRVALVANGADLLMFVNGELVAESEFTAGTGTIALNIFVNTDDAGRTQRTYCQLDNIWLWEF